MPAGVLLCLAGDVMTGRGVDQVLPAPGDPRLWEAGVRDARTYVELAEAASGRFDHPVAPAWPWGDVLDVLEDESPDVRVINLETSITACNEPMPGKGVHYRMSPANVACLTVARPDACVLANNHVLDFGRRGLEETLDVLACAGLTAVGAGRDQEEAERPAVLPAGEHRVLLWAVGTESSGVPSGWAATRHRPGVAYLEEVSLTAADALGSRVHRIKQSGDVAVVSIHWGSNWGYDVPRRQVRFARRLLEHGVDVVFGHSSHHPRPIELRGGGLVLYGCGDLVNDYEGIGGHEELRADLRLLYLVRVVPGQGVRELRMVPFRAHQMRLLRAGRDDAAWLGDVLSRVSSRYGTRVETDPDGSLVARAR